jgi:1,4-alpha-glucan branching enzyme
MRHPQQSDIEALVRGEHSDPHSLLGKHSEDGAFVIRAWRPEAQTVTVMSGQNVVAKLERIHPAGLFEGTVDEEPADYELEVAFDAGSSFTIKDPYSFAPTLGELDLHLIAEGRHRRLHRLLGAHARSVDGVEGTSFAVWAPSARSVRIVGDFNSWDGRIHPMRSMGGSGVWEIFVPGVKPGAHYKFEILTGDGRLLLKADPYALATEVPPGTASRVHASTFEFSDEGWMKQREGVDPYREPMSVYEVHLGSWRRSPEGAPLSYRELASQLADYCREMGFTHVELLPVAEHPFGGSWGYQVSSYFAPTARFGSPDDFKYLVDTLHREGIGVIVDWVPAHFPKDEWALARFDGTSLYEHLDPKLGEHPDWGTLVFNFGRNEVRNFLISNALYWLEEFHIDGLRVDAVASMLYLDYSREEGQWVPNPYGGNENIDAIEFLRELNTVVHADHPGVMMIAEESTAWPGVTRPVYTGGLGFGFKWNMGWMHDTLLYFSKEPVHRRYHHNNLTFSLIYAFSENFILPLSHDEVVHGKASLLNKMPGDRWQQMANLRCLLAYMWAHPGKQMLFMGGEIAQEREWTHDASLDWHLLDYEQHAGVQRLVADLNKTYRGIPALWEQDFSPEGFRWIDANDADNNVISFFRSDASGERFLVCAGNFSSVPLYEFRLGLPRAGEYREAINTDAELYAGSNVGNLGVVRSEPVPWHGLDHSAEIILPPLAVVWLYG